MFNKIIIASTFVLAGCLIFLIALSKLGWDFKGLSTKKLETNSYEITEDYQDIIIETDTADITFVLSNDGKCLVECVELEKETHSVLVSDNALTIKRVDKRKLFDYIGFNLKKTKITVYLPSENYGNLNINAKTSNIVVPNNFTFKNVNIENSTGDVNFNSNAKSLDISVSTGKISLNGVSCEEDIKLSVSTGKVNINNLTCKNFDSTGDTGKVNLTSVIVSDKLSIKRSTGDINLDSCDAGEIEVKTSTGDVTGTILSNKVFIVNTSTGKKNVPETTTGGICKITTSTGNIIISIK